jgi:hypothetical protein
LLNRLPNISLRWSLPTVIPVIAIVVTARIAPRVVAVTTPVCIGIVLSLTAPVCVGVVSRTGVLVLTTRCGLTRVRIPIAIAWRPIITLPVAGGSIVSNIGVTLALWLITTGCSCTTDDTVTATNTFPFLFISVATTTALTRVVNREFNLTQNLQTTQLMATGCPNCLGWLVGCWCWRRSSSSL